MKIYNQETQAARSLAQESVALQGGTLKQEHLKFEFV
jgi:hypothetical protein